ncbi:MAG: L,D-transpeptidase family protein [Candidatus Cloacimonadales bacterium]
MPKLSWILLALMLTFTVIHSTTVEELEQRFTEIKGSYRGGKITLDFTISEGILCDSIVVYRNYNAFEIPVDLYKLPISRYVAYATNTFTDTKLADNIDYYYRAVCYFNGEPWAISKNAQVSVPAKKLDVGELTYKDVHIEIDKLNYQLSLVADKDVVLKKYPLVMGENPFTRKIMRDWVSSPEGIYSVVYILKNATNYKAFDVDYPNAIDRVRYETAKDLELIPQKEVIGGDIQIHGMGINTNWTTGSFALRNSDIDEIIDSYLVRPGTKIIITGYEITPQDISYLDRFWTKAEIKIIQDKLRVKGYDVSSDGVLGPNSRKLLGNFQFKNGLKVTCQLDRKTCQKIGYIPYDVNP